MAPTLLGSHYWVACGACSSRFPVDADQPPLFALATCPSCGYRSLEPPNSPANSGDRLLIERITPAVRGVHRWEVVAVRDPGDPTQLAVKRVVGLPGETIALRDGAVWIDGRRVRRDLATIRRTSVPLGWEAISDSDGSRIAWRQSARGDASAWEGRADDEPAWLGLQPRPGGSHASFNDDLPYNLGATHAVHGASDLYLAFSFELSDAAELTVELAGGRLTFDSRERSLRLSYGVSSRNAVAPHRTSWTGRMTIAAFDDALVAEVALAGGRPASLELPRRSAGAAGAPRIGLVRGRAEIAQIELRRGIYYESPQPKWETQLGSDEYFLLGDNAARSIDSRTWRRPGVARNSLLGRVMRWPRGDE